MKPTKQSRNLVPASNFHSGASTKTPKRRAKTSQMGVKAERNKNAATTKTTPLIIRLWMKEKKVLSLLAYMVNPIVETSLYACQDTDKRLRLVCFTPLNSSCFETVPFALTSSPVLRLHMPLPVPKETKLFPSLSWILTIMEEP
jgi:hypothetical protein